MASKEVSKIKQHEVIFRDVDQSTSLECIQMVNNAFNSDKGYNENIDLQKYVRFTPEIFEETREKGRILIAFLKATDEMIGSLSISHYMENIENEMKKIIYLEAVAVSVNFQKRGVSKLLLLEAERVAKEMKGYAIEGEVFDFADWEVARLIAETDVKVFDKHKVTKIEFSRIDALKREMMITKLRKEIEY
ncbi:hypothetical protein LOD99_3819 [Oopsacas minuta]|uniref:N-acetyltransferase domain-containing protein n=1 Tax=Oopsacas minuta TaxID=111878 RepID=A0AAV7JWY2_9METZ|nr:hypothetical protein LOD99_3819 [Oopsacas minuta]